MADDLELATNLITRVNVGDTLTRTAARMPDQLAVVDGERRFTYARLNERVNRVANALSARGYARGDALALASGNSAEFLVAYFAHRAGLRAADDVARAGRACGHPLPRAVLAAQGGVRDGADARRAVAAVPRRVRLRLLPRVRADRDEPGDHILPARAPALARGCGRDAGGERPDRHHVPRRGPAAPRRGCLKDPTATADAFAHGWFHSGDVGRLDPDGMLWFSDRRKDVIKTGGENVASIEVEKAVYAASPDVAEAVVVGLAAIREHVDGYKVPKAVIVVPELPKTSTGKIQKNVVRDQHAGHYG